MPQPPPHDECSDERPGQQVEADDRQPEREPGDAGAREHHAHEVEAFLGFRP